MSQNSDWEKLSEDQQRNVNAWRRYVGEMLDKERDAFERKYPELRLSTNFTSEPLIRADHPAILEEL